MTFPRIKALGWAFGELLSAAQMTQLDIDHASAINGNGDTVPGPMDFDGAVRMLGSLKMGDTRKYGLTSRSIVRTFMVGEGAWSTQIGGTPNFRYDTAGAPGRITQWLVGSQPSLLVPIHLPNGAAINAIDFYIRPDPGHIDLPTTMPSLALQSRDLATGALNLLVNPAHSVPLATYNTRHKMTGFSGLNIAVDTTANAYYLEFKGETGGNSIDGLLLDVFALVMTVTEQDDGAS